MEIEQLKYFLDVCNTLSFSEAAKKNFISQPAISNSMSSLERQLNTKLFNRDTHSVSLTKNGLIFKQYAVEALRAMEIARSKIQNVSEYQGELIVCASDTIHTELAPCVKEFMDMYPNVYLNLRNTMDFSFAMSDLTNDMCFGYIHGMKQSHHRHDVYVLARDRFVLAYPKEWGDKEKMKLDFFEDKPFFVINSLINKYLSDVIQEICDENNFHPTVRSYCDEDSILISSIERGMGFGILPRLCFKQETSEKISLIEFEGKNAEVNFCCSVLKNKNDKIVELFMEILRRKYNLERYSLMEGKNEI